MIAKPAELQSQIQIAQVSFVTAASRLLDDAEHVRERRDELLKLLKIAATGGQETDANV